MGVYSERGAIPNVEKHLVNPVSNRIVFEIGNLKEPLRLLKDLLEEKIELQLLA